MANKVIVYSKQSGAARVPVTVRIDWLPDGTIRPLMYWTPDGACYEVTSIVECATLAFLKERGEGLRFKVMAESIDPEDDQQRVETYINLSDKRFCEKDIIDKRYVHAGKEYIPVTLDVFPDGGYELVYFTVHGARYMVEDTADVEPRGSFEAGGVGLRHKVKARLVNSGDDEDPDPLKSVRRFASLYLELNKWFTIVAKSA